MIPTLEGTVGYDLDRTECFLSSLQSGPALSMSALDRSTDRPDRPAFVSPQASKVTTWRVRRGNINQNLVLAPKVGIISALGSLGMVLGRCYLSGYLDP